MYNFRAHMKIIMIMWQSNMEKYKKTTTWWYNVKSLPVFFFSFDISLLCFSARQDEMSVCTLPDEGAESFTRNGHDADKQTRYKHRQRERECVSLEVTTVRLLERLASSLPLISLSF